MPITLYCAGVDMLECYEYVMREQTIVARAWQFLEHNKTQHGNFNLIVLTHVKQ